MDIEITNFTTLPKVLTEYRKQWSCDDIVEDIIAFICDQPDQQFENKLFAALQKLKADNDPPHET
jgi:hypothetical protein